MRVVEVNSDGPRQRGPRATPFFGILLNGSAHNNLTLDDLAPAEYITLETFRKNGQGVRTPVWQAPEGGKLYVWTQSTTWKGRPIRNNSRVRVCQSDGRAAPLSEWVAAQARVLDNPESVKAQQRRLAAKYGLRLWRFYLLAKLHWAQHVVIEISAGD